MPEYKQAHKGPNHKSQRALRSKARAFIECRNEQEATAVGHRRLKPCNFYLVLFQMYVSSIAWPKEENPV